MDEIERNLSYKNRAVKRKSSTKLLRADFSHIEVPEGARLIPLTQGKYALIDEEDYDNVSVYNWYFSSGYAIRSDDKSISLHRFIMEGYNNYSDIDHFDLDKLNNRKNNLRTATHQQNMWNQKPRLGRKYKGISIRKNNPKITAAITLNNKSIYLGSFTSEEEAAKAYDAKATELFGDFANLNFKI